MAREGGAHGPTVASGMITLLLVSRGGHALLTSVGMLKALNRIEVREFNPPPRKTHWGKRKVARDR